MKAASSDSLKTAAAHPIQCGPSLWSSSSWQVRTSSLKIRLSYLKRSWWCWLLIWAHVVCSWTQSAGVWQPPPRHFVQHLSNQPRRVSDSKVSCMIHSTFITSHHTPHPSVKSFRFMSQLPQFVWKRSPMEDWLQAVRRYQRLLLVGILQLTQPRNRLQLSGQSFDHRRFQRLPELSWRQKVGRSLILYITTLTLIVL